MGRVGYPYYGEDLGSAIENAEKVISKIKTNKFDKSDLEELKVDLTTIIARLEEDEN